MGAGADDVITTGPGDADRGPRRATGTESDPAAIAHDIEQTREEMTGTIDAIQQRLEPERLSAEAKEVAHYAIEEAKGAVRELAGQAGTAVHGATIGRMERMAATTRDGAQTMRSDIFTTIKANPIPAALAAVGIGWLWTHHGSESGQGSRYGRGYGSHYYDAYGVSGTGSQSVGNQAQQMAGEAVSQIQDRAGHMQHQLGDTAGQVQHRIGDTAGQVQHRIGDTAGQVQHRLGDTAGQVQHQAQGFWQMVQANPIAAAALGLGIGAIAGMVVPETEQEHQLMGETKDRVIGNVQGVASEALGKAQHIAEEAGRAAMAEAKSQGAMSGSQSASGSPA